MFFALKLKGLETEALSLPEKVEKTGHCKVSLILGGSGSTFCVLVLSLCFIPFYLGAGFKHF